MPIARLSQQGNSQVSGPQQGVNRQSLAESFRPISISSCSILVFLFPSLRKRQKNIPKEDAFIVSQYQLCNRRQVSFSWSQFLHLDEIGNDLNLPVSLWGWSSQLSPDSLSFPPLALSLSSMFSFILFISIISDYWMTLESACSLSLLLRRW